MPLTAQRRELGGAHDADRAARSALRQQIGRLERQLGEAVTAGFPHIVSAPRLTPAGGAVRGDSAAGASAAAEVAGPRLLGLRELELQRDALVAQLGEASRAAAARDRHQRRARALLAQMQLEPARFKFTRLRAVDLGERGCGVWEVRPRLGLIGMLAGWWQLKLSSGCPLAQAARCARPLALRLLRRPGAPGARGCACASPAA